LKAKQIQSLKFKQMKRFRVTFANYSLAVNSAERVEEICKNFYWQEENEPEIHANLFVKISL